MTNNQEIEQIKKCLGDLEARIKTGAVNVRLLPAENSYGLPAHPYHLPGVVIANDSTLSTMITAGSNGYLFYMTKYGTILRQMFSQELDDTYFHSMQEISVKDFVQHISHCKADGGMHDNSATPKFVLKYLRNLLTDNPFEKRVDAQ
jgi:hypothetical protein